MKKLSLLIAALFCVPLVFGGCIFDDPEESSAGDIKTPVKTVKSSAAPASDEAQEAETGVHGHCYEALQTDAEREAYDKIHEAVSMLNSEEFVLTDRDAFENLGDILDMYKDDHPEAFWLSDGVSYSYIDDEDEIRVTLEFENEGMELKERKDKFSARVAEILSKAPKNGSDYEKELFVNDWIVDNCEYDEEAAQLHRQDSVRANEQDAYGAIIDGKAVCEGYSRAFQLLCGKLGVDCSTVSGIGYTENDETGESSSEAHSWNCVLIGGDWYYADCTWNDGGGETEVDIPSSRYYYLNLTTGEISKDHEFAPLYSEPHDEFVNGFVPECTATEYNYFRQSCITLSDPDEADEIVLGIAKAASNKEKQYEFLVDESLDFEELRDSIISDYGSDWVDRANGLNNNSPELGGCSLTGFEKRRVMVILLKYNEE